MPVSGGLIFNFNQEAFELLAGFKNRVKTELVSSEIAHADETEINIGGKKNWLHCMSNDDWTFYAPPHGKRGSNAPGEVPVTVRAFGMATTGDTVVDPGRQYDPPVISKNSIIAMPFSKKRNGCSGISTHIRHVNISL